MVGFNKKIIEVPAKFKTFRAKLDIKLFFPKKILWLNPYQTIRNPNGRSADQQEI